MPAKSARLWGIPHPYIVDAAFREATVLQEEMGFGNIVEGKTCLLLGFFIEQGKLRAVCYEVGVAPAMIEELVECLNHAILVVLLEGYPQQVKKVCGA